MVNFQIFLLVFVPLHVQCSYNRRTTLKIEFNEPFTMPDHISEELASQLMIPNKAFCNKMALRGADLYMVMPWWYHYCERLTENPGRAEIRAKALRPFNRVLDKIATVLHFTSTASKKPLDISSEESIENILFYKDYRPKKQELAPLPKEPLVLPARVKQPECIPRMCCSMSCTNSCGQNDIGSENFQRNQPMNFMNSMDSMNPMNSMNSMNPMNSMNLMNSGRPMNSRSPMNSMNPNVPPMQKQELIPPFMKAQKKKKLPTIGPSRRDNGYTREHIKSLISQDEDIKKILKDLVRVTMKKVDLLEMIKARRAAEMRVNGDVGLNNDDDGKEL